MNEKNTETDAPVGDPGGLGTVDTFVCDVSWSPNRTVLVHRRRHGWREYILLRTWNRRRKSGLWYPTTRGYVVPLDRAERLAEALYLAVEGISLPEPRWLADHE